MSGKDQARHYGSGSSYDRLHHSDCGFPACAIGVGINASLTNAMPEGWADDEDEDE